MSGPANGANERRRDQERRARRRRSRSRRPPSTRRRASRPTARTPPTGRAPRALASRRSTGFAARARSGEGWAAATSSRAYRRGRRVSRRRGPGRQSRRSSTRSSGSASSPSAAAPRDRRLGEKPDELARPDVDARARREISHARRRPSTSGAASTSITFSDTWTRPLAGSRSPSAWTPRMPPLDSRTAAAIACASSRSPVARSMLNAIRSGRAPIRTPPPRGSRRAARTTAAPRPRRSAAAALPGRRGGRTPAACRPRSLRRGRPGDRARRPPAARASSATSRASSISPRRIGTIGTTSAAPIRG